MRTIVGIALLVLGAGALLCRWEGVSAQPTTPAPAVRWVRTADGWERPEAWHQGQVGPPGLHPLVLAAGQGLFSLFALAAFPSCVRLRR